ncbi:MAG: hypothetical protein WCT10_05460 [Patescibacteria group bacterium]|jgi:hypothetical protein
MKNQNARRKPAAAGTRPSADELRKMEQRLSRIQKQFRREYGVDLMRDFLGEIILEPRSSKK